MLAGFALLAAIPSAASAQAQDTTLNRTVVVEQEYTPIISDVEKINAVPRVESPAASPKQVQYDGRIVPARNIPAGHLPVYAAPQMQDKATPGYLRLGYGNRGNLDVHADYLLRLSAKDYLGLTLRMDGMDGTLDMPDGTAQWDSYFYRTHAAIGYRHDFRQVQMNLAGHFDLSNFNFLPGSANSNQKFTAGDFHLGVRSTSEGLPLQFRAETNLMFYERQHELAFANAQEVLARTQADVTGNLSATQSIGVAACMDNLFYRNNAYTDYTSLGLNPYYRFRNEAWEVRLGVHADLAFGFGKQLRVAPDVSAAFRFAGTSQVYVQARGGKRQNVFRRLERFNPYGQTIAQPEATYEQLDATLGFRIGLAEQLHLHVYGGYQDLKDDLYAASATSTAATYYYTNLSTWDTSNLYAGAEVNYDYKGIVSLSAWGVLRKWQADGDGEDLGVLAYKPASEGNIRLNVRPLPALRLHVGYLHTARAEYNDVKADPVSDLYAGASYDLLRGLSVWLRAGNLLDKAYEYYPGCPAQGIHFLGGASVRF